MRLGKFALAGAAAMMTALLPVTAYPYHDDLDFNLNAFCNPMRVVVENIRPIEAENANLTNQDIANAVESRIRSARLFSAESPQYLYINVNPVGSAGRVPGRGVGVVGASVSCG